MNIFLLLSLNIFWGSDTQKTGPQIRVRNEKLFSYFSTKTYFVGTHGDVSFEHPKHMFKLTDKKIITILC